MPKRNLAEAAKPKAVKTLTQITRPRLSAWSYSRWRKYGECPAALAFEVFDKIRTPQNTAMQRGDAIHKEGDSYIKQALNLRRTKKKIATLALPDTYKLYAKEMRELVELETVTEEDWAFTKNWEPTSWFENQCPADKMVWCRIKTDVHTPRDKGVLEIIDFKSGQVRTLDYEPQLELYALGGFKLYDGIAKIRASFWFLDHHVTVSRDYPAAQESVLEKKWMKRVEAMMDDTQFLPRPGPHCRNCPANPKNGGKCEAAI